jgi:hypothetical protein
MQEQEVDVAVLLPADVRLELLRGYDSEDEDVEEGGIERESNVRGAEIKRSAIERPATGVQIASTQDFSVVRRRRMRVKLIQHGTARALVDMLALHENRDHLTSKQCRTDEKSEDRALRDLSPGTKAAKLAAAKRVSENCPLVDHGGLFDVWEGYSLYEGVSPQNEGGTLVGWDEDILWRQRAIADNSGESKTTLLGLRRRVALHTDTPPAKLDASAYKPPETGWTEPGIGWRRRRMLYVEATKAGSTGAYLGTAKASVFLAALALCVRRLQAGMRLPSANVGDETSQELEDFCSGAWHALFEKASLGGSNTGDGRDGGDVADGADGGERSEPSLLPQSVRDSPAYEQAGKPAGGGTPPLLETTLRQLCGNFAREGESSDSDNDMGTLRYLISAYLAYVAQWPLYASHQYEAQVRDVEGGWKDVRVFVNSKGVTVVGSVDDGLGLGTDDIAEGTGDSGAKSSGGASGDGSDLAKVWMQSYPLIPLPPTVPTLPIASSPSSLVRACPLASVGPMHTAHAGEDDGVDEVVLTIALQKGPASGSGSHTDPALRLKLPSAATAADLHSAIVDHCGYLLAKGGESTALATPEPPRVTAPLTSDPQSVSAAPLGTPGAGPAPKKKIKRMVSKKVKKQVVKMVKKMVTREEAKAQGHVLAPKLAGGESAVSTSSIDRADRAVADTTKTGVLGEETKATKGAPEVRIEGPSKSSVLSAGGGDAAIAAAIAAAAGASPAEPPPSSAGPPSTSPPGMTPGVPPASAPPSTAPPSTAPPSTAPPAGAPPTAPPGLPPGVPPSGAPPGGAPPGGAPPGGAPPGGGGPRTSVVADASGDGPDQGDGPGDGEEKEAVPEGVLPRSAPEASLDASVKAPTREYSFSSNKTMDRRVTTAAGLSAEHGSAKGGLSKSGRFSDISSVSGGIDASTLFMKELQQDKERLDQLDEGGSGGSEEEQEEELGREEEDMLAQANSTLRRLSDQGELGDDASVMGESVLGEEQRQTSRGGALMSKHTRNMQRAVPEKVDELRTQYLKSPKVTVGHLSHYTRWVNSLHIWEDDVEPHTVASQLQTGLLLCSLMKHLMPETKYHSLNQKPRSRKPMMQNIEQALSVVLQKGSNVNTRRVPSAEQLYLGKPKQVGLLLGEVFEVFVMKDVYDHIKRGELPKSDRRAKPGYGLESDNDEWKKKVVKVTRQGVRSRISSVLAWMDGILKEYDAPLPAITMKPVELMEREASLMLELHETKDMMADVKAKMDRKAGAAKAKLRERMDRLKEDHQSIVLDLQELRKMPDHRLTDESLEALYMYFRSGTALFLLIRHFNGEANRVGRAGTPVDSRRVRRDPMDDAEVENNLFYVFALLSALQIPLLWAPTQFAHERNDDFLMLQLDYIHHYFHTQPTALTGEEDLVWREDLADQIVSQEVDRLNQDLGRSMGMDMDLATTKRAVTDRVLQTNAQRSGWNGSVGGHGGGRAGGRNLGSQANLAMQMSEMGGVHGPDRIAASMREGDRLRRIAKQGGVGGVGGDDSARWARNRMEMHAESQESLADVEAKQARLVEEKSQLEIDRQLRDLDLQREEVALETEYYQLGEQVNELDPDEYDNLLDSLERQRFQLEEGRRQFEEEYASRQQGLDMEELQLEESRVNAQREEEENAGMMASRKGKGQSPTTTMTGLRSKMNKTETSTREKGWNRNTHKNMTSTRKYDSLNSTKREEVDYAATASRFAQHSQADLSASGRGPISRAPPMNTQPGSGGQALTKQPQQMGSAAPAGIGGGSQVSELQRAIRDEERRLMAVEEERRWLFMEQQADQETVMSPGGGHGGSMGGGDAGFHQEQAIEVELPQTPEDLKEALDWLMEPKLLSLKERNSERQFEYVLFEMDNANGHDYQLMWYANGNPSSPEGFVLLSDIEDIKTAPSDATLFTLVLKKNKPQAVRNSGGLHIVCIRGRSAPECAMYRSGLLGLMATL